MIALKYHYLPLITLFSNALLNKVATLRCTLVQLSTITIDKLVARASLLNHKTRIDTRAAHMQQISTILLQDFPRCSV